jgi:hypothetical protein
MSDPKKGQAAPPAAPAKKTDEELELERQIAAEAAEAAKVAAEAAEAAPAVVPVKPAVGHRVAAGDVAVRCLKTSMARMGGRNYQLIKDKEVFMDPNHASELEETGWVLRRRG